MSNFFNFPLFSYNDFTLTPGTVFLVIFIYLMARLLVFIITRKILTRWLRRRKVDVGRRYAIRQIVTYLIYFIAILMMLQTIGLKFTALLAGSAALLVGIGIGLQHTFNDLVSGLILLIDASVEVGDVICISETIGRVKQITLRTTEIETRDESIKIIPNSKLVQNELVNWSHSQVSARFEIMVGVSYDSDVELVTELILQAARVHPKVVKEPEPRVKLVNFGQSSIDFLLQFYSTEYFRIEVVKSDIRYKVVDLFRQNDVTFPFIQNDIWFRNTPPNENQY